MDKIKILKDKFKDKALFDQALTHRSWLNENAKQRGSNERLEFLGDAVLELIVTDRLYKELPDKEEGYLTALRANIVNTKNLAIAALTINLGDHVFLSKGEADLGGRKNSSLLADAVEAIIGAIYLDHGMEGAKKFINENLLTDLDKKLKEPLKDAKSSLQEYYQAQKKTPPKYKLVKQDGPDNAKLFTIQVVDAGKILGEGIGKSKQEAQQQAASVALKSLNS